MKFKPEDFYEFCEFGSLDGGGPKDLAIVKRGKFMAAEACRIANARLQQMLAEAPTVCPLITNISETEVGELGDIWVQRPPVIENTVTAKLVQIERVK